MSFSRWYPVSGQFYDPALQPTKPMLNIQAQNDYQFRKIPKGRYDTTYRREYLNFTQPTKEMNKMSPYTVLPPITTPNQQFSNQEYENNIQGVPSIDHIISEPPSQISAQNYAAKGLTQQYTGDVLLNTQQQMNSSREDNSFLPREPVKLSPGEEQSLMQDVMREIGQDYTPDQLKQFYTELTNYDPNLSGFAHHMYITLVAMRTKLPISDSLLRFLMCKFVSPYQEPGYVSYEQLVKYIAKCIGEIANPSNQTPNYNNYPANNNRQPNPPGMDTTRLDASDRYDPDEQAILHLMHENMKEWEKSGVIDCDNLRKQYYDIDTSKRYTLTQRQIEDVLYKNRIPIQRSLIYQICEKYCKVSTGLYRWPAFVDFLEKTAQVKSRNTRRTDYVIREDEKDIYSSEHKYRTTQLDTLRKKVTEEERLDEIERQIYNLQNLKQETQQRIESRLDDVIHGESWFTRFMRLANAMYSHRVNAGIEFLMPKEEAKRLISAYNTVYDLKVSENAIDEGLAKCTRKGNVLIDDLLKVLGKVN